MKNIMHHFKRFSPYVCKAGLKHATLLSLPPEHWDYRYAPLCPVSASRANEQRLCVMQAYVRRLETEKSLATVTTDGQWISSLLQVLSPKFST